MVSPKKNISLTFPQHASKLDNTYTYLFGSLATLAFALILLLVLVKLKKAKQERDALKRKLQDLLAEKEALSAADVALQAVPKLSPHLLKNALNAIQSYAYQSYYALDKLSNVLDYILYESDGEFVPLKEELDFAFNLIEINRLKTSPLFDLRVRNRIDMEDKVNIDTVIAPFITINPIENAFKHADLQGEDSFISVVFEVRDGWLMLSVSNKVQPGSSRMKKRGGLGNKAFCHRLDTVYGSDYTAEEQLIDGIFSFHLKIKLRAKA